MKKILYRNVVNENLDVEIDEGFNVRKWLRDRQNSEDSAANSQYDQKKMEKSRGWDDYDDEYVNQEYGGGNDVEMDDSGDVDTDDDENGRFGRFQDMVTRFKGEFDGLADSEMKNLITMFKKEEPGVRISRKLIGELMKKAISRIEYRVDMKGGMTGDVRKGSVECLQVKFADDGVDLENPKPRIDKCSKFLKDWFATKEGLAQKGLVKIQGNSAFVFAARRDEKRY